MTAIFDLPNTSAMSDSRLGIHRKSEEYNLFYICVKFCSFGRIYLKIFLTAPTTIWSEVWDSVTSSSMLYNILHQLSWAR